MLVDNAGGPPRTTGLLGMSDDDWTADLAANLLSAVRLDRELLPPMIAQGSGLIVHIGPGAPQPAKAALTSYSAALATEVAPYGVRVVMVAPDDDVAGLLALTFQ